jgi:DNA-binding IscR family transcriptional regulator
MRVSAKVDYAVRAAVELAAAQATQEDPQRPVKAEALARAQAIPV